MDVLGVQQMNKIGKNHHRRSKRCNNIKKGIKVVYISSPMKVMTCASKFRALVQELTGKDSDADAAALRFSDVSHGAEDAPSKEVVDQLEVSAAEGSLMSSHSHSLDSEASVEPLSFDDDLFIPQREGSFLGLFTSNLFHHDFNFQLDHELT